MAATAEPSTRYHSLDHWRGIACLMVVAYHSIYYAPSFESPLPGETFTASAIAAISHFWIGVPVFFVISGYCIAASADATRRKQGSSREYFAKRLRRIFPPYWAWLAVCVVLVGVVDIAVPRFFTDGPGRMSRPWWITPQYWLGNVTLTDSWLWHFLEKPRPWMFMGQAWTLCYEEQFYVVVGVCLSISRRHLFPLLAIVTAAVAWIVLNGEEHTWQGFFFDGRWLLFAAGIAVYLACTSGSRFVRAASVAAIVLAACWAISQVDGDILTASRRVQERVVGFCFAAALVPLRRFDAAIHGRRFLWPLGWCGAACYSIYLVHWPTVKVVSHGAELLGLRGDAAVLCAVVPACIVASLLVAWPFHVFVERRFMNRS